MFPDNMSLERLTIPQLKVYAREHGLEVPTLRKADMVTYISGRLATGDTKKRHPKTRNYSDLIPVHDLSGSAVDPFDQESTWLHHLSETGWAVAPIPELDVAETISGFMDWLEDCCPAFQRDHKETWKGNNLPINSYGVFRHFVGHMEWIWEVREKCAPIFATIWGYPQEELLSSFDGCGLLYNPPGEKTYKSWIHNDQHRSMPGYCSVQGIVNLLDNGPDDGGLVLVEGSHNIFQSYMERHPGDGLTFELADMDDPELSALPLIKVCAPPGHIILFDSRIWHCNAAPISGNPRMCVYVSMQPREAALQDKDDVLKKRIKAYETGRMTGHWTHGPFFHIIEAQPHTYGKVYNHPSSVGIAPLTPLRSRLIGYN